MQEKTNLHSHQGWIKTTIIASIVAGLDVAVFVMGIFSENQVYLSFSIAGVGIITFFGMLMISSYHSIHKPESKGTMRKAIAGSLITVYIVVLALSMTGKLDSISNETSKALLENFAFVIITIIGFYFGTKGVSELLKLRSGTK